MHNNTADSNVRPGPILMPGDYNVPCIPPSMSIHALTDSFYKASSLNLVVQETTSWRRYLQHLYI